MTAAGDEPTGPTFVVFQEDAETFVRRRGVDEPVFHGAPSAAIQHAVDAGEATGSGTAIAIASGTYELDQPVALAASTWLAGNGIATTLRAAAGLNEDILTVPAGAEHVRVSDLRIDAQLDQLSKHRAERRLSRRHTSILAPAQCNYRVFP